MPKQLFTNNASALLTTGVSAVATTLVLDNASKFPTPTAGDYFYAVLIGLNANLQETSWEIVQCTARASNTLTVVRAQEGTAGAIWPINTRVELRLSAAFTNTVSDHLGVGAATHPAATTSVNGFMSSTDKTKLDGVATNATANTGTVTSVTGTAPVSHTGTTSVAISMAAATTAVPGYLTAADWTTFNNKQAALGYTPQNVTGKDATDGYVGLTGLKINLRNTLNTITSWFETAATVSRTWILPNTSGTIALTSDITGTNSGTNTGDNALNSNYITNANHTGDVTGATVLTIAANAVTNAKAAQVSANVIKGRITVGVGNVEDLTAANVRTILQDTSNRFVTDAEKTAWNGKQAALGFTPVQQGTGTNQGTNAIKIGWGTGAYLNKLALTIDASDYGFAWPIGVTGNAGTVTTNANLIGHVVSSGNTASLGSFSLAQLNTAISDADVATGGGTATGTNTGDNSANSTYASDYRLANFASRTNYGEPTTALATGLLWNTTTTGAHTTASSAQVTGHLLTNYVSGAGTVAATDTILQALNKLNGNDVLKAPLASPTFTTNATSPQFITAAAHSSGYGFWASAPLSYGYLMSASTDVTYGGRITGETTSDYNLYATMAPGTNRGFVFRSSYTAPIFSINPDRVRSAVSLSAAGGIYASALANPAAPAGTPSTTGGTILAGSHYAKVVAYDINGMNSAAGAESALVTTTGSTSSIVWTWAAVAAATSYRIYVGGTGAQANYFTVTTNTYTQTVPSTSGTAGLVSAVAINYSGSVSVPGMVVGAYMNMTHAAATNNADTIFYSSTDGFVRKNTATGFKTSLALNNVDNTTDVNKPVSTAQSTAIGLKANIASPVFTGNVTGLGIATGTSFNAITGLSVAVGATPGTASAGSAFTAARGDHVHPAQTTITGNAGTVTNATLSTALTVNTGTVTVSGNVANTSVLTLGAGASSVSGANTGDNANTTGTASNVTGIVLGANGGTGVANTSKTITLGGNLTTSGAFATTLTSTAATSVTLPTSGTLLSTAAAVTVAQGGTGATTLTGIVKGNGTGAFTAAAAGTDYQAPIGTISGLVKGNGANALTAIVSGTDIKTVNGTSLLGSGNVVVAAASGLTLLATITPTAAANVDFLNTFSSSYDNYIIIGTDLKVVSDIGGLRVAMAVAGAVDATYDVLSRDATFTGIVTPSWSNAHAINPLDILAGSPINFTLNIRGANNLGCKSFDSVSHSKYDSTPSYSFAYRNGIKDNAAVITGVRFYWFSGQNFTAGGKIRVYGYANT